MKEFDDKVKDGWAQLDRSQLHSPTKEDMIALIQETKRKQRREAILFFVITLILVNIVVFFDCKVTSYLCNDERYLSGITSCTFCMGTGETLEGSL